MIKMRKDIEYLQDEYGFTHSSFAKICGIAIRTIREFIIMNRNLSDKNFHLVKKHLNIIKEQIKEAEAYQLQDQLQDQDWIRMNDSIKQTTDIFKLKNVWEEKFTKKEKQNDKS